MKILCIYGCGGAGRELVDLAIDINKWDNIVFVDDFIREKEINKIGVFSLDEIQNKFNNNNLEFIVSIGEPFIREKIYKKLIELGFKCTSLLTPSFSLSSFTFINEGTVVHRGAVITCNTNIAKGCYINKNVVIGHDVSVGEYSVISPNASIGGNVVIGSRCYLGSGSIIRNGITIGDNSIIGMGSVVLKDVDPNSVVVGNPARFLRENTSNKVFKNN